MLTTRSKRVAAARALSASIGVAGALLCGCGTSSGPASTADPQLRPVALQPPSPRSAAVLARHLGASGGRHPPATTALKEVAYLIATAPLTNKVRAAAWQVMASLPGLRSCQTPAGQARSGTTELCIKTAGDEILVTVNPGTAAIVSVADRLMQTSPAYPHVAAGTTIGSTTFLSR